MNKSFAIIYLVGALYAVQPVHAEPTPHVVECDLEDCDSDSTPMDRSTQLKIWGAIAGFALLLYVTQK